MWLYDNYMYDYGTIANNIIVRKNPIVIKQAGYAPHPREWFGIIVCHMQRKWAQK